MPERSLILVALSVAALLLQSACGGSSGGSSEVSPQSALTPNTTPVADARVSAAVAEGSLVTLDGSASTDADGSIRAYAWSQLSGVVVSLNAADAVSATFVAPAVTEDTQLEFQLVVTDNDGASDLDVIAVVVQPVTFSLFGTISAAPGTAVDGDINDWNAPTTANSAIGEAQDVSSAVTVAGYVNVAGAGEPGPLHTLGDVSDFYRVDLLAGQAISLIVADPGLGDPDLYLWDASGTVVIDASVDTQALEVLTAPAGGEYLLEVTAYSGASSYTLVVGEVQVPGIHSGVRLSDDFVPGEVILERNPDVRTGMQSSVISMATLGIRSSSAATGRPVLAHVEPAMSPARRQALGAARDGVDRLAAMNGAVIRQKYATLLAMKALRQQASTVHVQPNYRVQSQGVPNDPLYALQWHYPMVDLPAAWDITTGDAGVSVAVLDTGVLLNHPDLAGQLLPGYDFVSNPSAGGDGDGIDADPDDPGDGDGAEPSSFHGTHVAGTIAAASGNAIGGTGVAPGVKILPVRVLGVSGGSSYDILQGIRYAAGLANDSGTAAAPVDVINLSLGRPGRCWPAEQAAFDAARQAGVVVVAAAGNDNADAGDAFPANCRHVMAVGAVDMRGVRASYSNFGSEVDVMAPGGSGLDSNSDGYPDSVLSLMGDDTADPVHFTYAFRKGTSMASPHVAGAVALMKSVNPALTPDQIDQLLVDGELTNQNGLINARKAVSAALNAAGRPVPDPTLRVSPRSLDFGSAYNYAEIDIDISGGDTLQASIPRVNESWLRVATAEGASEDSARYGITVDRSGLAAGIYADVMTITSASSTVEIPVIMQVSGSAHADTGHLYVLLVDQTTGAVAAQVEANASGGVYTYEFPAVNKGTYQLIAGSDADNDLFICDAGESCGGYPALDQPGSIVLDGNISGVDFTVAHELAIPNQSQRTGRATARAAATEKQVTVSR